jgi:phytoene dehydrogenase-like protein
MIEMVIPSSVDPTLAPPGCHVCLLFTQYTPYHLRNGATWDDKTKEDYAKQVCERKSRQPQVNSL